MPPKGILYGKTNMLEISKSTILTFASHFFPELVTFFARDYFAGFLVRMQFISLLAGAVERALGIVTNVFTTTILV